MRQNSNIIPKGYAYLCMWNISKKFGIPQFIEYIYAEPRSRRCRNIKTREMELNIQGNDISLKG